MGSKGEQNDEKCHGKNVKDKTTTLYNFVQRSEILTIIDKRILDFPGIISYEYVYAAGHSLCRGW